MRVAVLSVMALCALTAACGSDESQRAATGGLTGIGVGAVVGGPVGAAVGGIVGAAGGAAMPEGADTIAANGLHQEKSASRSALANAGLGPTAGSSQPAATAQAPGAPQGVTAGEMRQAQEALKRDGYYHAGIDGIEGPKTKAALSAYQQHEGLQQTAALDPQTMQRLGVNANAQANGNTGMTQGSSSTSTAQLSPSDLRGKLQQQGYNNVSDLKRNSDNSWSARADHNNQTVAVRVDAQSGRVLSEQTVASNAPNTSPDPSSGSSTPPAAPSTDNSTNH